MTGGPLEAAAAKYAAPVAKESWKWGRRLYQQLKPDHQAIGQCPNLGRDHYERVVMLVGVAPSRSAKRLKTSDYVHSAHQVADAIFTDMTAKTDYTGRDRVRLLVEDIDGAARSDLHRLEIYPSGFMLLQWGLDLTVRDDTIGPFPVSQFIRVLRRVHSVVQMSAFQDVHARRLGERRRRLDWRIGISCGVSAPNGSGHLYVSEFDTPRAADFRRAVRHDLSCPPTGFAPQELMGLKPTAPFATTVLRPVIEDLMANAGCIDPHGSTEAIMTDHEADWASG